MDQKPALKIPVYLVTGFLGSGKTTFLKRIVEDLSESYRIGVIQNEFAQGSFDSEELKSTNKDFKLLSINKGSVFCVCLLGSFVKSLQSFAREITPDIILLEASGLSDTLSVGEIFNSGELAPVCHLRHIYTIVEPERFAKMKSRMPRYRHQIEVADTLIVNKTDIESCHQEELEKALKELNPFAEIYYTSYCNIVFDPENDSTSQARIAGEGKARKSDDAGRPDIQSAVLRTGKKVPPEAIEKLAVAMKGKVYRMKGYIRCENDEIYALQMVFDRWEIAPVHYYSGNTEIMAMGPEVYPKDLKQSLGV